jgi:glycosyltransferase involved in cell wall biosynthesis
MAVLRTRIAEQPMRLAYLFRSGRSDRLAENGPREFTYGYAELAAQGADVAMFEESEFGLAREWPRPVEAIANRASALLGTHPRTLWALYRGRRKFAGFGAIVATNHTLGLALSLLHRLGLVAARPVLLTMGLVEPQDNAVRLAWLRWLLRDTVLAALSKSEAQHLRAAFSDGTLDIRDFVFGVDLDFWKPDSNVGTGDEILSVGNDPKRDFATLIAAWRPEFPILTLITALPVANDKSNIRIERGDWRNAAISDADLRARLQRARLVVVPLQNTLQPSGQSAALQAMACARPVVLSANRGLWDRPQIERHAAALLVPPGDPAALAAAVAQMLAAPDAAAAMGRRARNMLEHENVSSAAMATQIQYLAASLRA